MQLRWYQREAVDACWEAIRERKANPCIVAPTGAGKSLVIAELCREARERWRGRAVVVAHRKELLEQNAQKIRGLLRDVQVGLYSAGLKLRQTEEDVVVAGIQSVYRSACDLGRRDIAIVDEAHLISPSEGSMYRVFLDELRVINPHLKIIGLTATPFRTNQGTVTEVDGAFLDEICYETPVAKLIEEGFLAKLVTAPTLQVDMTGVPVRKGEFVQGAMEAAFLTDDLVERACLELISRSAGRKSVLVFTCGVKHAWSVWSCLSEASEGKTEIITGETAPEIRASILERFRAGEVRFLVNIDVLTTGFDAPNIDCIGVLRATKSPGLFAQMVGRGFRIAEGKEDCLVLDFGSNISRHGALDDPCYGRRGSGGGGGDGEAPTRECPECHALVLIAASQCANCGHEFETETEIKARHDALPEREAPILLGGGAEDAEQWFGVESVHMRVWPGKAGKLDTLRVDYWCSGGEGNLSNVRVSEWVCILHEGFPKTRAKRWWSEHSSAQFPGTIQDGIDGWLCGRMRIPARLCCRKKGGFWEILDREFEDERPEPAKWLGKPFVAPFDEEEEESWT
jgi:DNA repair protein RadD